jgi:hypothetical protein
MIYFEITESPDKNVIGRYEFKKNEVYIGQNAPDLSIHDTDLSNNHLLLEIPENELLVHPQKNVGFYLVNGKRSTNIKKLKVSDTLTLGQTTLKIIAFEASVYPSKKQILDAKLAKLMAEESKRMPVIESLRNLIK